MALTKEDVIDKMEVLEDGQIQIRTAKKAARCEEKAESAECQRSETAPQYWRS